MDKSGRSRVSHKHVIEGSNPSAATSLSSRGVTEAYLSAKEVDQVQILAGTPSFLAAEPEVRFAAGSFGK